MRVLLDTNIFIKAPTAGISILSKTTRRVIEDPFDRMLIATALAEDVPIVTTDRQLRRYRGLRVLS